MTETTSFFSQALEAWARSKHPDAEWPDQVRVEITSEEGRSWGDDYDNGWTEIKVSAADGRQLCHEYVSEVEYPDWFNDLLKF
jgi:hypothetical protein